MTDPVILSTTTFFEFTLRQPGVAATAVINLDSIDYVLPAADPTGVSPDHCIVFIAGTSFEADDAYAAVLALLTS